MENLELRLQGSLRKGNPVNGAFEDHQGIAFTKESLYNFLSNDKALRVSKQKDIWQGIAYVYACRLLQYVRTSSKKDLCSISLKNLTLSAAIAHDKGFPKEDSLSNNQALVTFNNLFVGSDVGAKVQDTLTKALPKAQSAIRSYTEEEPLTVEPTKVLSSSEKQHKIILKD